MPPAARATIAAAILVLATSACALGEGVRPAPGAGTTSTPLPPTTGAVSTIPTAYGGTVVIGIGDGGSPHSLNPFLESPDGLLIDSIGAAFLARGWIADTETGRPTPEMLESIPSLADGSVSDNGDGTVTVSVTVKDEAVWADGTQVSGFDLEFTVLAATDGTWAVRSDWADLYGLILPGSMQVSAKQLIFDMYAGSAYSELFEVVIPRHAVEGTNFASDWNDRAWVSAGPFEVDEFIPGQFLSMERNDEYWKRSAEGAPLPFLDRLVFRFYESADDPYLQVSDEFSSHDLDLVTFSAAQDQVAPYVALEGVVVETASGLVREGLARDDIGIAYWADSLEGPELNRFEGVAWNAARWRSSG